MILLSWLACEPPPLDALVEGPSSAATVIALHGLGDRPESLLALVRACDLPVKIVAPRGPIPHGEGSSWFDIASFGEDLSYDEAGLVRAVDRLAAQIPSWRNEGHPLIVTGFSQGGMLSFGLALRHPDLVDLALPVGGTWPISKLPEPLPADLPPIVAQHGSADTVVPLEGTSALVARLVSAGRVASLRVEEGLGHSVSGAQRAELCRRIADGRERR